MPPGRLLDALLAELTAPFWLHPDATVPVPRGPAVGRGWSGKEGGRGAALYGDQAAEFGNSGVRRVRVSERCRFRDFMAEEFRGFQIVVFANILDRVLVPIIHLTDEWCY